MGAMKEAAVLAAAAYVANTKELRQSESKAKGAYQNHKTIWLDPPCHTEELCRVWSSEKEDTAPCIECDAPPVEYYRADLASLSSARWFSFGLLVGVCCFIAALFIVSYGAGIRWMPVPVASSANPTR